MANPRPTPPTQGPSTGCVSPVTVRAARSGCRRHTSDTMICASVLSPIFRLRFSVARKVACILHRINIVTIFVSIDLGMATGRVTGTRPYEKYQWSYHQMKCLIRVPMQGDTDSHTQ